MSGDSDIFVSIANTDVADKNINKNDENSDNNVLVNNKQCCHIYFPPSASLSHHVCAKW